MSSFTLNQKEFDKMIREMEKEINCKIGVNELRKDSEKFLEIILKKREQIKEDMLNFVFDDFNEIPNIKFNINEILDDLKNNNLINDYSTVFMGGKITISLTMDGIEYFQEKERTQQAPKNVNNFYGDINNMQIQQDTINSTQTMEFIDIDKVENFIKKVKKYDSYFDDEFGLELSNEIRNKLDEISLLVQKKENSKIKSLLIDFKNLMLGVSGSLIASGILSMMGSLI